MTAELWREGADAADGLLLGLYGLAPLAKAAPDPSTPRGFDALVLQVLRALLGATRGTERRAVAATVKMLDQKWSYLTPTERTAAVEAASGTYLGFGEEAAVSVERVVRKVGPGVVLASKQAVAGRIEADLSIADERAVEAAARHQALFVKDEFGRRSSSIDALARGVVSRGLAAGHDPSTISEALSTELHAAGVRRAESYYRVLASAFCGRARTWGHLSSMVDGGFDRFEVIAVLDEVTSEVCRFMDGKVFSVARAVARYEEAGAAEDPEDIKRIQPWASVGKDADGNVGIFLGREAGRKLVARVDVGQKNPATRYSGEAPARALEGAGFTTPPYHGHCRTTIAPVSDSASVSEQPGLAPPPPPPPPPDMSAPASTAAGRIASGLGKLEAGADAAASAQTREATRDVLRSYGVVPRDRAAGSRKLWVLPQNNMANAEGTHDWDGDVLISKGVAADARAAAADLAANPAAYKGLPVEEVNKRARGLRILIHEELHGASRCTADAYEGVGLGMEEAATEILARKLTRELAGWELGRTRPDEVPFGLPVRSAKSGRYRHVASAGGSYNEHIAGLFDATARVAGDDGIHERIEQALLRTRGGKRSDKAWKTPEDQIRAYVGELGLSDADGGRLFAELVGPASPFRR